MTRVRSPGGWTDGSSVPGTEFEALDEGQHTAIKWGPGDVYTITGNPLTLSGTGLRVGGDGLKLDNELGPAYSGGMANAPLTKEFVLSHRWFLPFTTQGSGVWQGDAMFASQLANTADIYAAFALDLTPWHRQKLRRLRVRVKGGAGHNDGGIGTMKKPQFALVPQDMLSGTSYDEVLYPVPFTWHSDASTTASGYEALHWIDSGVNAYNITINRWQYNYVLFLEGESGSGSVNPSNLVAITVAATIDISTKPFG